MFVGSMEHLQGDVSLTARHLDLESSKQTWARYMYSGVIMIVEDANKYTSLPGESMWSEKRKSPEAYYLVN